MSYIVVEPYVVCVPTSSGGHLTVSSIMTKEDAEQHCETVRAVAPHVVRKMKNGPRCQFVVYEDLAAEFRREEDYLYTNTRMPHVSAGRDFEETMLHTDQAHVFKVRG